MAEMWDAYEVIVCGISLVNGLVSVFGNGTFIVIFCRGRDHLTPMNAYLISISVASLVIGLVVLSGVSYFSRPYHIGFASPHPCQYQWVKSCVITFSSIGIIYSMLAVAVERYLTCVGSHGRTVSMAATCCLIGVIWVGALLFTVVIKYFSFRRLETFAVLVDDGDGENMTALSDDHVSLKLCHYCASTTNSVWRLHIVYFLLTYVVPLAIMTLLYSRVIRLLVGKLRRNRHNNTERAKLRAIKAMVVNVCVFAISWVPFFAVQMMAPLYAPRLLAGASTSAPRSEVIAARTRFFFDFCTLLGTSNSWVHIVVYLRYSHQFTTAVSDLGVAGARATRRAARHLTRRFRSGSLAPDALRTRYSADSSQTVVTLCRPRQLSLDPAAGVLREASEV